MINKHEIEKCIEHLYKHVEEKTLKDRWACLCFSMGWFESYDFIPITVVKFISDLYCEGMID